MAEWKTDGGQGLLNLLDEINELSAQNRQAHDVQLERRLLRIRHRAGIHLIEHPPPRPEHLVAATEGVTYGSGLPEVAPEQLTPQLLRAGILSGGCLLVRGLVPENDAISLALEIERVFAARETVRATGAAYGGYYEEMVPDPPWGFPERAWIGDSGGVAAVDSPRMMFEMLETFDEVELRGLISEYLGENAVMSFQKCTLRKVEPTSGGEWHQDGARFGPVRALNVWLSLSHCGDEAPGLDIVPRRLDDIAPTGTEGALFDWSVSQTVAEKVASDTGTTRPVFDPGDVLFFDDMFLHKTAADPRMPNPRYTIESWFFSPSAYPPDYTPVSF